MCGIAGFLNSKASLRDDDFRTILGRMTDTLAHRGPDGDGLWWDAANGIGLGHRRLAILDLSEEGKQPMISSCGRFVISYNGEIYNHAELRRELGEKRVSFRGHSDTEILVEAISLWGLAPTLAKLAGMFAFALWDRHERKLSLARDRMGEKPLYYGWCGNTFLFGSETRPLQRHPDWNGEIDRDALALFLRHNCLPAPYSAFRCLRKLEPGTYLDLCAGQKDVALYSYWSVAGASELGSRAPFRGTDAEAIDELDRRLCQSIQGQMVADVPVGAFLSGGIDSSAAAAIMQRYSASRVQTFTIGNEEAGYDESAAAAAVAAHLGTDHHELRVTARDALEVIPQLPEIYDEPFADSSQIPVILVSRLARQTVSVALSGDGADELFAGYHRYVLGKQLWSFAKRFPQGLRRRIGSGITLLSPKQWDSISRAFPIRLPGDKLHKLAAVIGINEPREFYQRVTSHWDDPESILVASHEPGSKASGPAPTFADMRDTMMFLDQITYLPDDILVKLDRASMSVGLECRTPFLDHRLVEFAWSLPLHLKIRHGSGKWILRQALHRYVPADLVERPKMGFGVPIGSWLRGPLREWAEELLSETALHRSGLLQPAPIRTVWEQHLSGSRDHQFRLWDILMLQAWLKSIP